MVPRHERLRQLVRDEYDYGRMIRAHTIGVFPSQRATEVLVGSRYLFPILVPDDHEFAQARSFSLDHAPPFTQILTSAA
jgi:hypothetical protein